MQNVYILPDIRNFSGNFLNEKAKFEKKPFVKSWQRKFFDEKESIKSQPQKVPVAAASATL